MLSIFLYAGLAGAVALLVARGRKLDVLVRGRKTAQKGRLLVVARASPSAQVAEASGIMPGMTDPTKPAATSSARPWYRSLAIALAALTSFCALMGLFLRFERWARSPPAAREKGCRTVADCPGKCPPGYELMCHTGGPGVAGTNIGGACVCDTPPTPAARPGTCALPSTWWTCKTRLNGPTRSDGGPGGCWLPPVLVCGRDPHGDTPEAWASYLAAGKYGELAPRYEWKGTECHVGADPGIDPLFRPEKDGGVSCEPD